MSVKLNSNASNKFVDNQRLKNVSYLPDYSVQSDFPGSSPPPPEILVYTFLHLSQVNMYSYFYIKLLSKL